MGEEIEIEDAPVVEDRLKSIDLVFQVSGSGLGVMDIFWMCMDDWKLYMIMNVCSMWTSGKSACHVTVFWKGP